MYYINKIVGWVMSPMGLLFLGLAAGGLLSRVESAAWRRTGRWVVGLTLASVWALGCGLTTRWIGVPLEGDEVEAETACGVDGRIDAVVLLGGGMGAHEKCGRAEMFSGADRVWTAARVRRHSAGERSPKIYCSGGGVERSTVPLLVDLGVPREAIVCLPRPRNTEEEAKMIRALTPAGSKIALVTSAWHMPRAKMLFERAGVDIVPVPTDYEMTMMAERPVEIGDFFPNAEALQRNSYAIKEWVARFGYGLLRR